MADLILTAILIGVVGCAIRYIRKEKKRGVHCIGCPSAGTCAKRRQAESGGCCGSHTE